MLSSDWKDSQFNPWVSELNAQCDVQETQI